MRGHAEASSGGSKPGKGNDRRLLRAVWLCGVGVLAFLVSGASSAVAMDLCPNADFRKGIGALLPECRAYEQVSPTDKNRNNAGSPASGPIEAGGPVTADGSAAAFVSAGSFADSKFGGYGTLSYVSRRGAEGWSTSALLPPMRTELGNPYWVQQVTPDLSRSILAAGGPLDANPAASSRSNFYERNNLDGTLTLRAGSPNAPLLISGASEDLGHLAFTSPDLLTTDPNLPEDFIQKVYEAVGGQVRLVSRQPNGEPFQEESFLGAQAGGYPASKAGAVSTDGNHIFFTPNEFGATKVYRRSFGTTTTMVSPSKRTVPDEFEAEKIFRVATPDANRVFFTSNERLTDDARRGEFGGDLYRYDIAKDELIDLTASVIGPESAEVAGVVGIDNTGSRVYFVAYRLMVPGKGIEFLPNLYLWEDDGTAGGTVRFITTLDSTEGNSNGAGGPNESFDIENWSWDHNRMAEVTRDGSRLLFHSRANVTDYDSLGTSQIYLYDAEASQGAGKLTCVSCAPTGASPASFARAALVKPGGNLAGQGRAMSSNGSQVVFSTATPLLARDSNGVFDAYLWNEGQLSLLSSGTDSAASYGFGISATGDDAFFRTPEALVPADVDTLVDLYTAHVGGGFASQYATLPASCADEACQQQPTPGPDLIEPSTNVDRGSSNATPRRNCARFVRSAKGQARAAERLLLVAQRAKAPRAERLRERATALSAQSKKQRVKAKRCRRTGQAGR